MIRAMTGRSVAVAVPAVLAREQPIQGIQQVIVRSGPDLQYHQTRGRMRHEQREQSVLRLDVGEERRTGRGQVGEAAGAPRPNGQEARVYGKMLRSASRRRPMPPIAGADS